MLPRSLPPAAGPAFKSHETIHLFTRASVNFGPLSASHRRRWRRPSGSSAIRFVPAS